MTKASIVQRLLDNDLITAEEAVVLLKNEDHNGITYIPYAPYDITNPYNPPFQPYCTSDTLNSGVTLDYSSNHD